MTKFSNNDNAKSSNARKDENAPNTSSFPPKLPNHNGSNAGMTTRSKKHKSPCNSSKKSSQIQNPTGDTDNIIDMTDGKNIELTTLEFAEKTPWKDTSNPMPEP
eukprot:14276443-Ditylum_brightwellii.AAC.1